MTDIPIIDLSPMGEQASAESHSGNLGATSAEVSKMSKTAKAAFEQALGSWDGGPRRALFQHAATGIQAEILTLISAASSASDLTNSYVGALHVNNQQMDQLQQTWTSEQLKLYPAPAAPDVKAEVIKNGHLYGAQGAALRRKQKHFGALIAADFDKITNLLVPGGAKLSPDAIARKVRDALGAGATGTSLTPAQIAQVLGIAAKAAPAKASKENGDLDLNELARSLNDKTVTGAALGGEGWAITNLVKYHVDAASLAHQTNVQYARITGQSLQTVEATQLGPDGNPSSILKVAAQDDVLAKGDNPVTSKLANDIIAGGGYKPGVAGALGLLGLVSDYTTLQHLDEIKNPTERTAVKYASWANALGISRSLYTTLLAANSGDEVPGWGEAVATLTGVFLAGDYLVHDGPNLLGQIKNLPANTKDGIINALKSWALSHALAGFGG